MAEFHPINLLTTSNKSIRKDLTLWCGTTFVIKLLREYVSDPNESINLNSYHTYAEEWNKLKDIRELNYAIYSFYNDVDKIILNIREKTGSWSDLGSIIWSLELEPFYFPEDRPINIVDFIYTYLEIPSSITETFIKNKYTYEIISLTNEYEDIIANDIKFFSFKKLLMFGDLITKQPGEI